MVDTEKQEVRRYQNLEALNVLDGVTYAFSPRNFGNMAFPYGEMNGVIANRRRFLTTVSMNLGDVVFMRPVHKVNIEAVGVDDKGKGSLDAATAVPSTDALITTEKGVALALNAADCAPVIVTNTKTEFLALYHAGREGTNLQIGQLVVSRLREMGFTNLENFVVGIGPLISKCCYKQQYLQTHTPGPWIPYSTPEGKFEIHIIERINNLEPPLYKVRSNEGSMLCLDLAGYNRAQLTAVGIPENNISISTYCTACDAEKNLIFSHVVSSRYEGTPKAAKFPEGRLMAVAQLSP